MIEEVTLNDVTPSGYTSDVKEDGVLWYDRGKGYPCVSDKIKKECNICRHKNLGLILEEYARLKKKKKKSGTPARGHQVKQANSLCRMSES